MPKARCTSYTLAFKLKVIAEAEAVENNSEIARDYGISESMVRRWRRDQGKLLMLGFTFFIRVDFPYKSPLCSFMGVGGEGYARRKSLMPYALLSPTD